MSETIAEIKARHEEAEASELGPREWEFRYSDAAHADRATLLRALDEAQARAERAEAALSEAQDFLLRRYADWNDDARPVFPDPDMQEVYAKIRAALNQESKL